MTTLAIISALAWLGAVPTFAQHRAEMCDQDRRVAVERRARRHRRVPQPDAEGPRRGRGSRKGHGRGPGSTDPARFDADGDGAVSRDAFVRAAGVWFQMSYRDANGILTMEDFRGRR